MIKMVNKLKESLDDVEKRMRELKGEIAKKVEEVKKQRALYRRRICKLIRTHQDLLEKCRPYDYKNIQRKCRGGWLGDYSNGTLIDIAMALAKEI